MNKLSYAIAPVLILILVGFVLKRSNFLSDSAWSGVEKLTYFILFPTLLIRELSTQNLTGLPWQSIMLITVGTILLSALLLVIWKLFLKSTTGPAFTSIFQGGIRFNTYIAFAVANGAYGSEGLAIAAAAAGFMIVVINILCILAFSFWGEKKLGKSKSLPLETLSNPLIIACAVGWLMSITQSTPQGIPKDIIDILSKAALPLGLLSVGAALQPELVGAHMKATVIASIAQFGAKPFIAAGLISLTGVTDIAAGTLLLIFTMPTAPSGVILSRQLGGDTETMASIITLQTAISFLIMPAIYVLLK